MRRSSSVGGPLRVRNSEEPPRKRSSSGSRVSLSSFGTRGRQSFGAGGKSHSVGNKRTSAFGTTRRSSGYGKTYHDAQIKDTRNVASKSFKDGAMKRLLEFLQLNDYNHPVSLKILASPQTKHFTGIFEFLMTFLDPSFKLGKKMEEEIPKVFKAYGYPFPLTKTSMFAVGTLHTWPTLLAALDWLRELIQCNMTEDIDGILFGCGPEEFDAPVSEKKVVFDYVSQTYKEFLSGNDDFRDYERKLIQHLNQTGVKGSVHKLEEENKRLAEELEMLQNAPNKLETLQSKLAEIQLDLKKLEFYESELTEHHKSLAQKSIESKNELIALEAEFNSLESETNQMQRIYETQEFTQSDAERLNMGLQDILAQINLLESDINSLDQKIWEKEIAISKEQEKAHTKCSEYNQIARMNKLIPSTAECAQGYDVEVSSVHWQRTDMFTDVKMALTELKKYYNDLVAKQNDKISTNQETLDQISEMVAEKEQAISNQTVKLKRVDEDLENKKQEIAKETACIQRDVEKAFNDLQDIKKVCVGNVTEARRQLEEAKKRYARLQKARDQKEAEYDQAVLQVVDCIVNMKTHIQESASDLLKFVKAKRDEYKEME